MEKLEYLCIGGTCIKSHLVTRFSYNKNECGLETFDPYNSLGFSKEYEPEGYNECVNVFNNIKRMNDSNLEL